MRDKEERNKNETPEEIKVSKAARKTKRRRKGIWKGRPIRLGTKNEIEHMAEKLLRVLPQSQRERLD